MEFWAGYQTKDEGNTLQSGSRLKSTCILVFFFFVFSKLVVYKFLTVKLFTQRNLVSMPVF